MNLNCFAKLFEMFQNKVRIIWPSTSFGEVDVKQGLNLSLSIYVCIFYLKELKLVLWPNK